MGEFMLPLDKLEQLTKRYSELEELMCRPDVLGDRNQLSKVTKERSDLEPLIQAFSRYREIEKKLKARGLRSADECDALRAEYEQFLLEAAKMVTLEPKPEPSSVWDHVFADRDIVGEGARKVPHDNRLWKALACTFPTTKVSKNGHSS